MISAATGSQYLVVDDLAWVRSRTRALPVEDSFLHPPNQDSVQEQMGRDQNSAGRYPLISRPMQISTRVGVVQAIGIFLSVFLSVPEWQQG
jgi:hypothetical protein